MRNALLTLILLAILATIAAANPAGFFAGYVGARVRGNAVTDAWESAGLNTGLVSYWAMRTNGTTTVYDEYGSNDGTAANSPTFSAANGVRDDGVGLVAASSQWISLGNSGDLNFGQNQNFSISAWINRASINAFHNIFTKGRVDQQYHYLLRVSDDNKLTAAIRDSSTSALTFSSSSLIWTNSWRHVVAVFDRQGNGTLYINGAQDGTPVDISSRSGTLENSVDAALGSRLTTSRGLFFNGSIDEVAIWNRALSSNEVFQIYNTPLYAPYKQ